VGYYVTIAPICLREMSPIELRRMLGYFFSLGKIVGVMIVISLTLIFAATSVAIYWRVLFTLSCGFAVLQAVLVFFFVRETPTELIEKGLNAEARKQI
jgi:sugar phosphate permease